MSVRQHLQTPIADTCGIFSKSIANLLPVCVFISLEMVSQTSGITTPLSRESTSGLTIRQLPLTIRSGLGVLDNPPNYGHENIRSDLQIKKPLSPPYETYEE